MIGKPMVKIVVNKGRKVWDRLNKRDAKEGEVLDVKDVEAKILKFRGTRTMIGADLYNAMNSAAILTYNNAFSSVTSGASAWRSPTSVLTGRMIRISGEFSF